MVINEPYQPDDDPYPSSPADRLQVGPQGCGKNLLPRVTFFGGKNRTPILSMKKSWLVNDGIHGTIVYLPTWMVDFHGIHVGKYT